MADPTKRRWKELAVAGHLVGELRADTVQHMTQMQKRTFTNWVNLHLRDRIMMVRDLFADFEDGVLLINLIEIISGSRSVGKYNKKPKIINQKLENVQMALDFLNKEGIKLVNIGNSDIVEGNSKLILGLIWTLILRYHITKGSGEQGNAKSELLRWVRSKIPRYNIQNFTTDWNSGNALCALVNALKRGTCPDHQTLDGSSLDKAQKGISLAESELNIPPLISAEDMTDPKVDDLSMMTYISFFRNLDPDISEAPVAEGPGLVEAEIRGAAAFVIKKNKTKGDYVVLVQGPNGPVEVKTNTPDNADYINVTYIPMDLGDHVINVTLDGEHINDSPFHPRISLGISAVNAHGDGLERGNPGEQAKFVVEPNGYDGELIVLIKDPSGQDLSSQIDKNEAGIYECSYLPPDIGEYTISITMNGKVVPNSPFVAKIGLDVSAVSAHGPGLEQPATGRNAEFVVEPNGIKGDLKIVAVNPQGEEIPCESNLGEDGNYACHYLPNRPGDYVITISMNGLNIPNSPFTAKVETDVGEVRAFGPGLEGGQADDSASFIVDPKGTGENAELQVIVKGPNGEDYPATMSKQDDGTWACSYEPTIPGDYEVSILLDGKHVPGSPFTVHIDPNVSKINAHGPGLEAGETGQPAPFKVEPNGQDGDLKVTIKGPNGEEISANINKDESGNYDCSYLPNAAGVYEVSITMSGKELPQSPFKVDIAPDASKIKAHGPGLESATSGQPAEFVVEMNGVSGEPQVSITNSNGEEVPVQITQDENGNFLCHYEPAASGLLTVSINANGKPAAQSPYQVPVEPDISKIVASGPGLEGGEVGFPAIFGVEINGQDGDLEAMVQQPDGEILPITLTKNSDGDYDCEYLPTNPGDHTIFINMNGKDIPNSPFKVTIEPEGGDKQGKVVDKETGKRRIRDGFKNGRSAFLMGNGVAMSFAPDSETAKRLTWENFVQNMKRIVEEKLELSDVQWETDLSKLTDQIDQKLSEMAEDSEVNREFLEFEVVSDTYNVIRTMPIDLKAGMADTLRKFQQKGLPKIPILTVNSDDFLEIVMGRFPMLAKDISPKKLEEAEVAKKFIVHLHGVFTRRDDFALTSREYNESAPQFLKFFQEYNSKIRRSLVMLGCHKTLFDPHFVSFFDWYNSLFEEPAQKAEQISSTAPYSHTDNALLQLLQAINGGQFSKVGELEQHLKEGLLVELGPGGSQEEANLHKVITALKDKLGEFTRKAAWAREVTNVMKSLPKKLRDAVKETIQDGITQHYWIVTDKEANSCQKLIEQRGWTRIIAVVEYGPQYSDLPSFLGEIAEQLGKQ